MPRKYQPVGNRILVRRDNAEEKTTGGILLPDTAQEKPLEGVVIGAGPGRLLDDGTRVPMEVKVGQRIMYGRWAGQMTHTGSKITDELIIMRDDEVLAIVEE